MADERVLKQYSEHSSKYASSFKSAYDAVKVLKTKVDKEGEFVKHSEVQENAEVIFDLFFERGGAPEIRKKLGSLLVELGFAQTVVDICSKVETVYPECFTWDREKTSKVGSVDIIILYTLVSVRFSICSFVLPIEN